MSLYNKIRKRIRRIVVGPLDPLSANEVSSMKGEKDPELSAIVAPVMKHAYSQKGRNATQRVSSEVRAL